MSIVGPNGSGKTTLLRCLLGLVPYTGSVFLNDKDIQTCSRKDIARSIGYVPQVVGTLSGFTVEQFVSLGRYARRSRAFGLTRSDRKAITEALRATDCASMEKQQLASLSGGERQRVLLAATLAQEPDTILLDEPASFLDPKYEVELYQTLQTLHRDHKKGICIVGHNINSATAISERIIALRDGQIVFDGTSTQFMTEETLGRIYETDFSVVRCPESSENFAITRFAKNVDY